MEIDQLKNRSATLFNYIMLLATVNILSFLGTTLYIGQQQEAMKASQLETTNPELYANQMATIKMIGFAGFSVAILAIIFCIPFVLKRGKLVKQIQELELKALDELDI